MLDENNVGFIDRLVRVALGVLVLVLAQTLQISVLAQALLIVLGSTVVVTGGVGFCLLYQIFGIRTAKVKSRKR